MGREVRMVPPNWEHPRYTADNALREQDIGEYRSCYDEDFESAAAEWKEGYAKWEAGEHKDYDASMEYWEWDSPPDRELYRQKFTEEPTWFQMYQTVSEGSPVSPPFATKEELARYLSENGDFWYQDRIKRGRTDERKPTYEQALAMINAGHAPSMMVMQSAVGVEFLGPYEIG